MDTVQITHFSDALCVWAYVSQVRCDELLTEFEERASIEYRYFQVFGNVAGKMDKAWAKRGGIAGYAEHVQGVTAGFPHVKLHADVWVRNTPTSSMPAHLLLCGVRELERLGEVDAGVASATAWAVREAFFARCEDISARGVLLESAQRAGVEPSKLEPLLEDGRAHAALSVDLESAREFDIRASPTLTFNEGRQRLAGNVGYRILEANVRELLEHPDGESSWC